MKAKWRRRGQTSAEVDGLASEEIGVDAQKFARHGVAGVVIEEDTVALVLDGIAAGDDVDQQTAIGDPIERRSHPRGNARRLQAGPNGDEVAQPLGERRNAGGDDPRILAASPGRQQHAEIAELVGGLRDLAQIVEIDLASADRCAEITAVAMGRQEPEDVGLGLLMLSTLLLIGRSSFTSPASISRRCRRP